MVKISQSRINLENARLEQAVLKDYHERLFTLNATATTTLDISQSNVFRILQSVDIGVLNVINPASAGTMTSITIIRQKDNTATSRLISWPFAFKWASGVVPTLSQTAGAVDTISAFTVDGGITWYAFPAIDSNNPFANTTTKRLYSWGLGTSGELGNNGGAFLPEWSTVAAGGCHSVALKTDSTLWAWGQNDSVTGSGSLGDNTTINKSAPVQIGAAQYRVVAAGLSHSLAVKTDSTLWAWGANDQGLTAAGQIGDNTTTRKSSPTQIGTLATWSTVSAGDCHSLAVKTDGTLWAWGRNDNAGLNSGHLGLNGSETDHRSSPTQVGTLATWSTVAAGPQTSFATKTDGTLWAWGSAAVNGTNPGHLGVNDAVSRSSPAQVGTLTTWSRVAAGRCHAIAIKTDSSLWAWGNNASGRLGDATTVDKSSPTQVGTLLVWSQVIAGRSHSVARKTDSTLWAWGVNDLGQLGDTTTVDKSSPVQVGTLSTWSVATAGHTHSLGIASSFLLGWGSNARGQLGDGTIVSRSEPVQIGSGPVSPSSPTQVGTLADWDVLAAGSTFSVARKSGGTVWAWGLGSEGQMGDSTTLSKSSPTQIGTLSQWALVTAAAATVLAKKADGTIWTWGRNSSGALGDESTVSRSSPVQIGTLTTWSSVVGGNQAFYSIKTDSTLWAWGNGGQGQIGDSSTTSKSSPVQVGTLAVWRAVASVSRTNHVLALKTDSTLWVWGFGTSGQIGDNTTTLKSSPTQIGTLAQWRTLGAVGQASLAIKTDSTLWAWGINSLGSLGDNTTVDKSSPVQIGTLGVWEDVIGGGDCHAFALRTDNTLWMWGQNANGQLGDSTVIGRSSPTQIGTLAIWSRVGAGFAHTLAVTAEVEAIPVDTPFVDPDAGPFRRMFSWGLGTQGQLGDNFNSSVVSPTQIGTLSQWALVSGGCHSVAIKTDSTLWAWGPTGSVGQLGDNSSINKSSPVQIGTLATWALASASTSHTLALKTDSTLWAWGAAVSAEGRLGDNTTIAKSSPVQIGTLATWSQIATGNGVSFAIKTDSTLWGWGANGANTGQLGLNDSTAAGSRSSPTQIGTLAVWARISAGGLHTLAIKTDSTLWAWGANAGANGQLGDSTTVPKSSPTQIGTLADWAAVSAGSSHSLALKTDSTLWVWGGNTLSVGQTGLNDSAATGSRSSPTQIGTLGTWAAVSAGFSASFARKIDGTIWAWGTNTDGRLGVGDQVPRSSPTQIGTLTGWSLLVSGRSHSLAINATNLYGWGDATLGSVGNNRSASVPSPTQVGTLTIWTSFSGGDCHSLALKRDSTLWAWGTNADGRVGDATGINRSSPVQVGGFPGWSSFDVGASHNLAVGSDGTLWSWGANTSGRLGSNNTTNASAPIQIGTLTDWSLVSAGDAHSLGVKTNSTLWAWGAGTAATGRLGDSTTIDKSSPTQIGTLNDWRAVAAGNLASLHSLAIKVDGTLWTWGANTANVGQLGLNDSAATGSRSSPTQIGTLAKWSQVSVGAVHSLAVQTDGTLWAWGGNTANVGQLGVNLAAATGSRSSPTQIGTLATWAAVAAINSHSFALKTDRTLWVWGNNASGQLGDGTTLNKSSPTQLGTLNSWSFVKPGISHTLALFGSQLFGWGLNTSGQVGNTNIGTRPSPVQIGTLAQWAVVAAGHSHTAAVKTDSTLWVWGANSSTTGAIGDNTTTFKSSPTQIGTLAKWASVVIGNTFSVARQTDGTLWSWGQGSNGVQGTNTTTAKSSPTQIGTLAQWARVAANSCHAVAVKTDSTLWAWGAATTAIGRLGDNTTVDKSSPTQIGTLATWSKIAAGLSHTLAIKTDSTLWGWGVAGATSGHLGDGTTVPKSSPVQIGTLADWAAIAAGDSHSLAVKTDSTLWSWGSDLTAGVLGANVSVTRSSPAQVGTLATWATVEAATNSSYAIKTDGTFWVWGLNTNGRLGDGTFTSRSSPTQIGTLANWSTLAIRSSHVVAVNASRLFSWGLGTFGQLGDNQMGTEFSPVQIGTLSNWAAIAGGSSHSLGRTSDQSLRAWGSNNVGQIGIGSLVFKSSPTLIGAARSWRAFSAGSAHSVAVSTDGTLWAWGSGASGQLGNELTGNALVPTQIGEVSNWTQAVAGTSFSAGIAGGGLYTWGIATAGQLGGGLLTNISSPAQVGTLTTWSSLTAARSHSLALQSDSTLWTWGSNSNAQLGINVGTGSPRQIGTITGWTAQAAGQTHSIAVKSDSTLWAWGQGTNGIIGDNTTLNKSSPVQVGTLAQWLSVAAATSHTLAIKTDSTLWAWGANAAAVGQLGDSTSVPKSSPTQIGTLARWSAISAMTCHTLATQTDSTLWAWGVNTVNVGQLGINIAAVTGSRSSPTQIGTLATWASVSASISHSMAVKTDSTLWAWGGNSSGQLGDNTTTPKSSPVQVGTLAEWAQAAAGSSHSVARKTNGTVWAWGLDSSGQLGDNLTTSKSSPSQVGTLVTWAQVAAGTSYSHARKTDGTLWGWGLGTSGQIGDNGAPGTIPYFKSSPTQIGTRTDWASISDGGTHAVARLSNGALFAWGIDNAGQLGHNQTDGFRASPVQVGGAEWRIVARHANALFSSAIKTDGTLWTWGAGTGGPIGDSTVLDRGSPTQVGTFTDWVAAAAGASHIVAVRSDSSLWAWGDNSSRQLGDGTDVSRSSPVQIGTLLDWDTLSSGGSHSLGIRVQN